MIFGRVLSNPLTCGDTWSGRRESNPRSQFGCGLRRARCHRHGPHPYEQVGVAQGEVHRVGLVAVCERELDLLADALVLDADRIDGVQPPTEARRLDQCIGQGQFVRSEAAHHARTVVYSAGTS